MNSLQNAGDAAPPMAHLKQTVPTNELTPHAMCRFLSSDMDADRRGIDGPAAGTLRTPGTAYPP